MEACCSRFTAAEGGARLAAAAAHKNILAVEYASFIPVRLLYEKAYQIRGSLTDGRKRSAYVTRASRVPVIEYELKILTDLSISRATLYGDVTDWRDELNCKEVIVCTGAVLKQIIEEDLLCMLNINVLILDSCHMVYEDDNLKYIMQKYKQCDVQHRPIILALTYPLFTSKKDINKDIESDCKEIAVREKRETVRVEQEIGVYENRDDFDMYEKLEWRIEEMEKELCCQMDLAEDVDGGKRISASMTKPRELIIEYSGRQSNEELSESYLDLEKYMRDTVAGAMEFINDHRHDPTEIYGEEMYEEFMNIPDPTIDPKHILNQFLYVLDQLGPYAADKAAFSLLTKLEKLKIKVPYERHFLLLCLCTTVFVQIRCYADAVFSAYENDWDKIQAFCTPKVLRFAQILEKFQPPDSKTYFNKANITDIKNYNIGAVNCGNTNISGGDTNNTTADSISGIDITSKMLNDIEQCDFNTLGDKIQDQVNIYQANLKDIDDLNTKTIDISLKTDTNDTEKDTNNTVNSNDISIQQDTNITKNITAYTEINIISGNDIPSIPDTQQKGVLGFTRRAGHRVRGRTRVQRNNAARVLQMHQNPDALCAIVYMKEALMAKILFMLVVDMSRCNRSLSYLCAQYCATEQPADPGTEPKECQRQGKKQEEVLKKFRMHECNLLLATSALEEGIDLPRCNLVLRWDVPPSYRSYGVCRARARAARATAALLCSHNAASTEMVLHNLATYRELDQIISRKCGCGIQDEPPQSEEDHADTFTSLVKPYSPSDNVKIQNNNNAIKDNIKNDKDRDHIDISNDVDSVSDDISKDKSVNDSEMNEKVCVIEKNDDSVDDCNKNCNAQFFSNDNETDCLANNKDSDISDENKCVNDNIEENKTEQIHKNETNDKFNDTKYSDMISHKSHNDNIDTENIPKAACVDKIIKNIENIAITNNECVSESDIQDIKRNLNCNKCNSVKNSGVECPCVISGNDIPVNISNIDVSKCDSKKNISDIDSAASVDLNSAIALINRYCGKLPSDTFTRLAPQWSMEEVDLAVPGSNECRPAYICTLRLPLNCPVKYNIVGHPMPTKVLARRMVALQACRILHKSGELDNQLMPIGKENFKAAELEGPGTNTGECDSADNARPGTTKRRQYYYKRTAWAFTNCQPVEDTSDSEIDPPGGVPRPEAPPRVRETQQGGRRNMLYLLSSRLWCALPERYNTRGRRLHAPQHAPRAMALLMARRQPDSLQIPAFPVYTRSGEVRVSVEHVPDADVRLSPRRGRLVRRFMRFVFSDVLRVRRRGMKLQSEGSTHNNYYIVPTIKTTREDGSTKIDVDWAFLELIYQHTEDQKQMELEKPVFWQQDGEEGQEIEEKETKEKVKEGKVKKMDNPLLKPGEIFVFDPEKYREAVVTPWYRNQDQPQFFLVAEICWNLTPDSAFPSATHTSFRDYYSSKYGVTLTQKDQPLLDVDHTSARLNLLTPRYVNRKGVALPVSSERTRRAKRDRLDQKQILVPELCRLHPFAAPLWFATVALPCVLYRINALLIADEIRRAVAIEVGLGIPKISEATMPGYQWPPLDFGWSLAEVLNADSEMTEKRKEEETKQEPKELRDKDDIDKPKEAEEKVTGVREKTINDILQEKEDAENGFEIGTWSNDMASSIPQDDEYDEFMEPLPPNLTFCTSASGGTNWCDPIDKTKNQFNPSRTFSVADSDCSFISSDLDSDDSDLDFEGSDEDTDTSGFCSSKNSNAAMGVRIEYKTAHEAEAVDLEQNRKVNPAPLPDPEDDAVDRSAHERLIRAGCAPDTYIDKFRQSVLKHKEEIIKKGHLIAKEDTITHILPEVKIQGVPDQTQTNPDHSLALQSLKQLFPYGYEEVKIQNGQVDIASIERNKRKLLTRLKMSLPRDVIKKLNCFSMADIDIDSPDYVNEKIVNVGFDDSEKYEAVSRAWMRDSVSKELNCVTTRENSITTGENCVPAGENWAPIGVNCVPAGENTTPMGENCVPLGENCAPMGDKSVIVEENLVPTEDERVPTQAYAGNYVPYYEQSKRKQFDFDYQPKLEGHPGPSPSVILQALTMSNANDGINLERLETIGDSFLKFAITAYLYCAHPTVHEGKLSHMRSKQVSNLNLYRLGRSKRLGARMIASKFEPHDNWLPPCHRPPHTQHHTHQGNHNENTSQNNPLDSGGCFIPYNLITQHSIPDKSIADCVEALIGAYLLECGPRGALLFMSWLGIRVLPTHRVPLQEDHPYVRNHAAHQYTQKPPPPRSPKRHRTSSSSSDCSSEDEEQQAEQETFPEHDWSWPGRPVGSLRPYQDDNGKWLQPIFGELKAPPSPLLRYIEDPEGELEQMLSGYDALERTLQYRFRDRSLLLQALTHASHQSNRLTDCYQRLEFLGDAILDYLITRHLYEDPRRHSPGALTDLRSALVNNTIFATLAARHGFHKYFRHMSPGLNEVLTKYVKIQEENGHSISEEHYLIQEDEMEQAEDVEVPKALGDLFESVAGAIFLDSGMSLDAVWKSYVNLMGAELEAFSAAAPKSPVRELLEAEPDTAKFGKPERLADGRRVRVCVEVFGRGAFKGVGRNYRIAKGTAARCALRHLRAKKTR